MTLQVPAPTVTAPDWSADPIGWCLWYLRENPQTYAAFRAEVDRLLATDPNRRISADQVMHTIRTSPDAQAQGDHFKANNNAVAMFARVYQAERRRKVKFGLRRSILDDLDPSSTSQLAFAASRIPRPVDLGPLFGGRA